MKILHMIDTAGPGGAESVFAQLVCAFRERHNFHTVATIPREDWLSQQLRSRGVDPVLIESKGSFSIGYMRALIRLARRERVDVIHSHLLGSSIYAAIVGSLLRIPVVATIHGPTDFVLLGRLPSLKRKLLLRGVSQYVAVSDSTSDAMITFGIPASSIVQIANGIDVSRYASSAEPTLRKELGIQEGEVLVGAVGNIRKPKAYDVLLKAASLVITQRPNVHFVVAGAEHSEISPNLELLRQELGLKHRFRFLGLQAAGPSLYRSFDIFVSSSSSEGLPMTFLEAMSSSRAVVATASGGAQQVLGDNQYGVVVPVNDPVALANALLELAGSPSARTRWGELALSQVTSKYSIEACVEQYSKVYQRVVLNNAFR